MIKLVKKTRHVILLKIFYRVFISLLRIIEYAKVHIFASKMKYCGKNITIDSDVWINQPENISIGEETFIGRNVYLNAYDSITIGSFCGIAAGCKIITGNHDVNNLKIEFKYEAILTAPIIINDGVWLGYNVIVLPGVTLGKGCVVGAGSVVTKSFDDYSVIAGVPAKLIKMRNK